MIEAEWLECSNPEEMLQHLRGRTSERKLRLADCGFCRRLWHLLTDERSRRAVLTAELFADGQATAEELRDAGQAAREAAEAAWATPGESAAWQAWVVTWPPPHTAWVTWHAIRGTRDETERRAQCQLLHDLFDNPFQPVTLEPVWRTSEVLGHAQAVYDLYRFEDLPRLADALEAVGCTHAAVLDHCRSPDGHARGCWVVDLLLGKS